MKKIFSLFGMAVAITALLSALLTLSVSASSASTDIDCVIMDFSSEETFATNAKFLAHQDNGYDKETDSFNNFAFTEVNGVGCLEIYYKPYGTFWSPFRVMPRFNSKNAVTEDHHYIRVTYMTDDIKPSMITIINNGTGTKFTVVPNTIVSGGNFVRSNVIDIYEEDGVKDDGSVNLSMIHRFIDGDHCSFEYTNTLEDGHFYLKEIAFFKSEEDAYAYYGDEEAEVDIEYSVLSYVSGGTGAVNSSTTLNYGNNTRNYEDGTVDIFYAETTNFKENHYMAKLCFSDKADLGTSHKYVRILYAADMPESAEPTTMSLTADSGEGENIYDNITDTNGEFVLTAPQLISDNMYDRFKSGGHNSLVFATSDENCVFKLKAIYFFRTEKDADAFSYTEGKHDIEINGNSIENYRIVIAEDAPLQLEEAAKLFAERVKSLTGFSLPMVTDSEPEQACEILFGRSNRSKSYEFVLGDNDIYENEEYKRYASAVYGDTLVLTAHLPYNIKTCTEMFLDIFLYNGLTLIPDTISLDDGLFYSGKSDDLILYENWTVPENVADPEVFTDDFSCDDGYFMEENNGSDFSIGGFMYTDTDDFALTYLHLYETNAVFSADITYSNAGENGDFGLMLRYNSADAWVKAGYDFEASEWYIDSKDGIDFYTFRLASKSAILEEGETYRVEFTADGSTATLTVNGALILQTNKLSHFSPGRVAIYADDISLKIDNTELKMLSGQGELMRNVTHNKLPTDKYTEGGTVIERADGVTASYIHHDGYVYDSTDGGKTWIAAEELNSYIPVSGYYNVIRLNNGDLLQIVIQDGYVISRTSSDDGVTWTDGGQICQRYFNNDRILNASAGNMNDKLFQCSEDSKWPGRILYSSNYEAPNSGTGFDGRYVFCEFYYSDDNGATWQHSETDSWEIEGNENATHFGECKFLELDDGTIRMYNSWNYYDCIVYADSDDGGVTFGPLQFMYDFPCSTSSMQFVRDKYADNNSTYYMVWVDGFDNTPVTGTRCGLSLAYSEDGRTWTDLGVIWRWQSTYFRGAAINHVVDPFIQVTKDCIICGSGISDGIMKDADGGISYHQGQRQNIYSIPKITFVPEENFAKVYENSEYRALAEGTQLVMIESPVNDKTYSFGDTVFYYSDKYMAHVAILSAELTKTDIFNGTTFVNTPADELSYNCDITGDGRVTAGDAAFCSQLLHDPNDDVYTTKMRLEADCFGEHATDEQGKYPFVSVLDALAMLLRSVGL